MKFHFTTFLAASELLALLQYSHGLLLPSKNLHGAKSASFSPLGQSPYSASQHTRSPLSPHSKSSSSSVVLYAEKNDDRVFKAGGGVPKVPTGELKLFDPGEQGMNGGTMDLAERLKSGVSYHKTKGSNPSSNGASSSSQPSPEPELSLFDPGEEGMKGGTADFAERLKGGVNFQQSESSAQQQIQAPLQENGAAESSPEPVAPVQTSSQQPAAPQAKPTEQRAFWPYQPMIASSSPAYPTAGIGRGRAAAIQRSYRHAVTASSGPAPTQSNPAKTSDAVNGAKPSTAAASPDPEPAISANSVQRQHQERKAAFNKQFWGKQSNWWDTP